MSIGGACIASLTRGQQYRDCLVSAAISSTDQPSTYQRWMMCAWRWSCFVHACRTTSRLDASSNPTRQFSLDVLGAWRDNGPVLPVVACNLHNGNRLNRHTDDALLLPGLVQLEIIPRTTRGTLWRLPPRPPLGRHPGCVG